MLEEAVYETYIFSRPGSNSGAEDGAFLEYLEESARIKLNQEIPPNCIATIFSKNYRLARRARYKELKGDLRVQTDNLFRKYGAVRGRADRIGESSHLTIFGVNEQAIKFKKSQLKRELKELLGLEVIF